MTLLSRHAPRLLAHVAKIAGDLPKDHLMVMNMCGRGDKDVFAVARHLGIEVME